VDEDGDRAGVPRREGRTGAKVKAGDTVKVHYTGTFKDARSSTAAKIPAATRSSHGREEPGHPRLARRPCGHEGRRDAQAEKIPYQLAYGENGKPPTIPPKSELHFEIELLRIE